MKQGDKELLLKDLCARLPYKLKVLQNNGIESILDGCPAKREYCFNLIWDSHKGYWNLCQAVITDFKPYLRSMSSMTENEKEEYGNTFDITSPDVDDYDVFSIRATDWFNEHMFDVRGLIEKGLALEAPEGMYDIKD